MTSITRKFAGQTVKITPEAPSPAVVWPKAAQARMIEAGNVVTYERALYMVLTGKSLGTAGKPASDGDGITKWQNPQRKMSVKRLRDLASLAERVADVRKAGASKLRSDAAAWRKAADAIEAGATATPVPDLAADAIALAAQDTDQA